MATTFARFLSIALTLVSLSAFSARAQQPADSTNRELAALVQKDQLEAQALVKAGGREADLRAWVSAGAPRRELVRRLIRTGGLVTADDYANGALLLQHGDNSEDFLLAHVLATIAGFKGSRTGRFLSAVALDRYLLNVGQPQAFGSQPTRDFEKLSTALYSMAPNVSIITDVMRREYAFPLTAAQIQQRNQAHNDSLSHALPATPGSSSQPASCALQGTWRLESVRFVQSATDTGRWIPIEGLQLKVINATHFAYIRQLGDSQTVDFSGRKAAVVGSHVTGGAGSYTLSGNNYTEQIEIAEPRGIVGLSNRATCVVEGDRWLHSFDLPNGRGGFREVYRRVSR